MTYAGWLLDQITEIRTERRRAQWRLYAISEKGRARNRRANARYANTVRGQLLRYKSYLHRRRLVTVARIAELEASLQTPATSAA